MKLVYDVYKETVCDDCDKVIEKKIKVKRKLSYYEALQYLTGKKIL